MGELDAVKVRRVRALVEAAHKFGEDLLGKAQRRAPIEEGNLRGSFALAMIVNGTRHEGETAYPMALAAAEAAARAGLPVKVEVEVSANTVYAARQHEELEWHHPLGGEAKYLERPLQEESGRYLRLLALADHAALAGRDVG